MHVSAQRMNTNFDISKAFTLNRKIPTACCCCCKLTLQRQMEMERQVSPHMEEKYSSRDNY